MPFRIPSLITAAAILSTTATAAPLTVIVEGVEARGGPFYVSVQTEDQFMKNAATAGEIIPAVADGTFVGTYDVPPGSYAVSIWHDDNGNGEFDSNEDGMPLDGWAMSGGPLMGPPTFEDVSVAVRDVGPSESLTMSYHR